MTVHSNNYVLTEYLSLLNTLSVKLDYDYCQNINPYFFSDEFQNRFLVKWQVPNNNDLVILILARISCIDKSLEKFFLFGSNFLPQYYFFYLIF